MKITDPKAFGRVAVVMGGDSAERAHRLDRALLGVAAGALGGLRGGWLLVLLGA